MIPPLMFGTNITQNNRLACNYAAEFNIADHFGFADHFGMMFNP